MQMKSRVALPLLVVVSAAAQVVTDRDAALAAKQAGLGAYVAASYRQQTPSLESTDVQQYVGRLARTLAPQNQYSIEVLAGDLGNAIREPVWLPGGHILVPAPLFLAVESEVEFAAMLAHAIAHIENGHAKPRPAKPGGIPLTFSTNGMLPVGMIPQARANELEADVAAVRILADAGFNPSGLLSYISRVQPPDTDRGIAYTALPPRADRIRALEQALRGFPPAAGSSSREFTQAQEEVRRLSMPATHPPTPVRNPPTLRR